MSRDHSSTVTNAEDKKQQKTEPLKCPKCGSTDVVFVEHMAQVSVYRCRPCGVSFAVPLRLRPRR